MSVRVSIKVLQAVSSAANFNSEPVMVAYDRSLDLTIVVAGAANGTLSIATTDGDKNGTYDVDVDATAEIAQPSGASAGRQKVNFENMRGRWWRLQWVGSGAGSITANANQGDALVL